MSLFFVNFRGITALAKRRYFAVTYSSSPYVYVYNWDNGFGTVFSNAATLLTRQARGIEFNKAKTAVAISVVATSTTSCLNAYAWSGSGFGTKFANPATIPTGIGRDMDFTKNDSAIAIGHDLSPYVSVYAWSNSGFGTKFSNPATLPPAQSFAVRFNPENTVIAVSHYSSPRIGVYAWSSSGFGTKFANPASLPEGDATNVVFSPAGTEIAITNVTAPRIAAYPWSSSGFGTRYSNPGTAISGTPFGVKFNTSGNYIGVAHDSTGSVHFTSVYDWTSVSGFGSRVTPPSTILPGSGRRIDFSKENDAIATGGASTPNWLGVYSWSSAFGTRFSNPATAPTSATFGVRFDSAMI